MEHRPVMLNEAIEQLAINPKGIYVDATLGGGSHALAIVKKLSTGHLYAFDQDEYALRRAQEKLASYQELITVFHGNFADLKNQLKAHNVTGIDGILFDLGVSSFHLDDQERGFSYRHEAILDMRMDQSQEKTAQMIVNQYSFEALKDILYRYGDEKFAPSIAENIVKTRQEKAIVTTFDLVDIIKKSMPQKALSSKGHPAKRTFQAIRIEVNDELNVLKKAINDALTLLNPKGRIVVITFQSLEDKIVKQLFKDKATIHYPKELPMMPKVQAEYVWPDKKLLKPSEEEIEKNHRAHSAKMRVLMKQ